jgi:hypothetical protein
MPGVIGLNFLKPSTTFTSGLAVFRFRFVGRGAGVRRTVAYPLGTKDIDAQLGVNNVAFDRRMACRNIFKVRSNLRLDPHHGMSMGLQISQNELNFPFQAVEITTGTSSVRDIRIERIGSPPLRVPIAGN